MDVVAAAVQNGWVDQSTGYLIPFKFIYRSDPKYCIGFYACRFGNSHKNIHGVVQTCAGALQAEIQLFASQADSGALKTTTPPSARRFTDHRSL